MQNNQDQVLLSMQQKLDDLCDQVNPVKDKSGTEEDMALKKNADLADSGAFGHEKIKFVDCGCWLCDEHLNLFNGLEVKTIKFFTVALKIMNSVSLILSIFVSFSAG